MVDTSVVINASKAIGIYSLLLIIVGTIGNAITCIICMRPKLRKHPTFIFLAFSCFSDIFTLYTWNLSNFITPFFHFYHEYKNLAWCKISVFIQFWSLQSSAWVFVMMTVERFFSISIPNWYPIYFNQRKAVFASIITFILAFLMNCHLLVANGFTSDTNETMIHCYNSYLYDIFPMWSTVHNYMYSVIPGLTLLVFNVLLCKKIIKTSAKIACKCTSKNVIAIKRHMTLTIIFVTIAFLVSTLPTAISSGYFFEELYSSSSGRILFTFFESITFTFHSTNFIAFLIVNKQFRRELKEIIKGFRGQSAATSATISIFQCHQQQERNK